MYKKIALTLCFLMPLICHADVQTQAVTVNKFLIDKIERLKPSSSNAHELEVMLGAAAACLPMVGSSESWMCQWKGNLNSNRLENSVNVLFEGGMIAHITAIDSKGNLLTGNLGHAASQYPCTPNNAKGIDRAIKNYIAKTAISSKEVTISAKKCVGNYAYAEVVPNKPITDTAMVYLHKEGKGWQVMDWGTSFDETFLAKLPKELRVP